MCILGYIVLGVAAEEILSEKFGHKIVITT